MPVADYVAARRAEFDRIAPERRTELEALASILVGAKGIALVFVCTHNSRRSQLAQAWAHVAAHVAGVAGVRTFSGGTEVTACDRRTVAALERAGFDAASDGAATNPRYTLDAGGGIAPVSLFSKTIDDPTNPSADFVAVMTCSSADAACPVVAGATHRAPIRYDDPKAFDDTPDERAAYDDRCAQIAREMVWLFDEVAKRV